MSLWVSYAAIQFPAYRALKSWLHNFPALEETPIVSSSSGGARMPSSKSSVAAVIAGGAAGAFATVVTYPFDWIRTRFACQGVPRQYDNYQDLLRKEYARSGGRVSVFFQGLSPNLIAVVPQIAITFATYERASAAAEWALRHSLPSFIDKLTALAGAEGEAAATEKPSASSSSATTGTGKESTTLLQLSQALGGGIAGAVSKFAVYPLDTVKKRLQTQEMSRASYFGRRPNAKYNGVWDALWKIAREDRAEQLLKSAPAAPATATATAEVGASGPGGATITAGSHSSHRPAPFYYRAPLLRHLFLSSWFPFAWFKGLSPSLIKAAAGAALTFWSYEAASRALFDNFEWARAQEKAGASKAKENDS
jgi:Mitochondrial carrier protein